MAAPYSPPKAPTAPEDNEVSAGSIDQHGASNIQAKRFEPIRDLIGDPDPLRHVPPHAHRDAPNVPIWLRATKRAVDSSAAISFFIIFGWLFVLLWAGVLITSGGPALYSQKRYGKDGRVFKFYKFRSMVANADQVLHSHLAANANARKQWDEYQKLEKDPRITKFGAFIRKASLDELPQFWNVLVGDMSLVGPRPCMLFQKELYGPYWTHYCAVRPGITGLWQVSGRNNLSYKKRIALDVKYVETLSVWKDIHIFFKTIWVVATGHGSK